MEDKKQAYAKEIKTLGIIIGVALGIGCFIPIQHKVDTEFTELYNTISVFQPKEKGKPLTVILSNKEVCNTKNLCETYYFENGKMYDDSIINKKAVDFEIGGTSSTAKSHMSWTKDCYILGLYCPDDYSHEHRHITLNFAVGANVKVYNSDGETYVLKSPKEVFK